MRRPVREQNLQQLSEEQILQRQRLFDSTIVPHIKVLKKEARNLTNDAFLRDDLVQKTLLKAWVYLESFVGKNVPGVLRVTLKRIYYNEYKHAKNQPVAFSQIELDLDRFEPCVEVEKDIYGDLRAAIESLPAEFREPLELSLLGFSLEEIADTLKIRINTVKSRIHRAKQKIKSVACSLRWSFS